MKLTVTARSVAVFDLMLPLTLIDTLKYLSVMHYDRTCCNASKPGGFLYLWGLHYEDGIPSDQSICFSVKFSQLDLISKIMEIKSHLILNKQQFAELGAMNLLIQYCYNMNVVIYQRTEPVKTFAVDE